MNINDDDNIDHSEGGGLAALSSFREVWLVDFEFQAPAGERPRPVCMVARELRTGRLLRLWRDELLALDATTV